MDGNSISSVIQNNLENNAPYLSLDFSLSDLGFPTDEAKGAKSIVWAPNGTCKSTIYQAAKNSTESHSISCISYEDDDEFDNDYIVKGRKDSPKKELVVSPGSNEINDLIEERHSIVQSFNLKGALKTFFGITTVGGEKSYFRGIQEETEIENFRNASDGDQAKVIRSSYSTSAAKDVEQELKSITDSDKNFFLKNYPGLKESQALSGWTGAHREIIRREILERVSAYVFDHETVCPVCGASRDRTIKEIVNDALQSLTQSSDKLRSDFFSQASSKSPSQSEMEDIENRFDSLRKLASSISEKGLLSYAIRSLAQGDNTPQDDSQESDAGIERLIDRLRAIRNRIDSCEKKRSRFYQAVKHKEETLKSLFSSKFSATVTFDDEKCQLRVSLPRDIQSYSTGEKNLMVFMIRLMAYRGDMTDLLIIDDPLSSYDSANQYSIMFELVDLASDKSVSNSSIVIFTHNMKCISIAESQWNYQYNYFILDKSPAGADGVNPIRMAPLPLGNIHNTDEIFTLLNGLSDANDFANSLKKLMDLEGTGSDQLVRRELAFLKADRDREKESKNYDAKLSELFHFNQPFTKRYNGQTLDNNHLVQYIDSFNSSSITPVSQGVARHWLDKIYCTFALRVWIEKQFFDNLSQEQRKDIEDKWRYIDKVDYIFPINRPSLWHGSQQVSRGFLLSQKVLLNQSEHVFSQPVPYEYCLNINTSDLYEIVVRIKKHFENTSD